MPGTIEEYDIYISQAIAHNLLCEATASFLDKDIVHDASAN